MTTQLNIGVPNPRALAEIVLGRRVDWKRVTDPDRLVEQALGMKLQDLLDPSKKASPLSLALSAKASSTHVGAVPKPPAGEALKHARAHTKAHAEELLSARRALLPSFLRPPVASDAGAPWDPAGTVWADPGTFFDEGTEFFDPVQGGLADCWLIAAMSAVAWARPYTIAQRTRATGVGQQDFVDEIDIHSDDGSTSRMEVTERINLLGATHAYQWARSSEAGEIWPAVYEKAFAKWRGHYTTDEPDMTALNYGDCVDASLNLTGLAKTYFGNGSMTGATIWQTIRANSLSYRTFNPMTCWTYGAAPAGLDYGSARVVANHCYTILGWNYVAGTEYIVLRNPWGFYEATLDTQPGSWTAYDQSFWRPVTLGTGGVFSIKADTFQRYWAGFGVVS